MQIHRWTSSAYIITVELRVPEPVERRAICLIQVRTIAAPTACYFSSVKWEAAFEWASSISKSWRQNRTLTKILQRMNFHLPWHCLVYDLRLDKWMFTVTDFNWRPESSQVMKESCRCQGRETRDDQKINSSTYVHLRELSVRGSEKRNPSIESREFIEHHVARPFHRYSMESFMRGRVYAGSSSVFGDPTAG